MCTRFALPIACTLLAACSGKLGHVVEETVSSEIAVAPEITGIRAEVQDGSLTFVPIPARVIRIAGRCQKRADTEAQLELLKEVPAAVEVAEEGAILVLRAPATPPEADPMQTLIANQLVLELPPGLSLEVVATRRGHLSVKGWQAPVRLDSAHGDLELGDCQAGATLRTGSGRTLVYGHGGDLDVQARSGAIWAWIDDPGSVVRLVTGSGGIQCKIPPDRAFRADARTERGKVTNGFGLPERRLERYGAAIEGAVGEGGTDVVIRSGAGRISLGVLR